MPDCKASAILTCMNAASLLLHDAKLCAAHCRTGGALTPALWGLQAPDASASAPFEDAETKAFYESLPDLRGSTPAVLLGDGGRGDDEPPSPRGHESLSAPPSEAGQEEAQVSSFAAVCVIRPAGRARCRCHRACCAACQHNQHSYLICAQQASVIAPVLPEVSSNCCIQPSAVSQPDLHSAIEPTVQLMPAG